MSADAFYEAYSNIQAAIAEGKIENGKGEYLKIIGFTKSADIKNLVTPIIAKFAGHFPDLLDKAIDALLDLCEDDSSAAIRMDAIRGFRALTEHAPQCTARVTMLLTQLLVLDEEAELQVLSKSLAAIFAADIKQASSSLFHHITNGKAGNDLLRSKIVEFFAEQVKKCKSQISANMELQQHLLDSILAGVGNAPDLTENDLALLFRTLSSFEVFKDNKHPSLLNRVKETVEAAAAANGIMDTDEGASKFNQFLIMGSVLAQKKQDTSELLRVFFSKLEIAMATLEDSTITKLMRTSCRFANSFVEATAEKILPDIYGIFAANASLPEEKISLTTAEICLYLIHQIGKKNPDIVKKTLGLKPDEPGAAETKQTLQGYVESLTNAKSKKATEAKAEVTELAKKKKTLKGDELKEASRNLEKHYIVGDFPENLCVTVLGKPGYYVSKVNAGCEDRSGKAIPQSDLIPRKYYYDGVILSFRPRRGKLKTIMKEEKQKKQGAKRKRGESSDSKMSGVNKLNMSLEGIAQARKEAQKKEAQKKEAKAAKGRGGGGRGRGRNGGAKGGRGQGRGKGKGQNQAGGGGGKNKRSQSQPPSKRRKSIDAKKNNNNQNSGKGRGAGKKGRGGRGRGGGAGGGRGGGRGGGNKGQGGQRQGQKRKRNQNQQNQQQQQQKQGRGGRGGRGRRNAQGRGKNNKRKGGRGRGNRN
eukprot:jgi/Bigna1/134268/aug1.24_g8976